LPAELPLTPSVSGHLNTLTTCEDKSSTEGVSELNIHVRCFYKTYTKSYQSIPNFKSLTNVSHVLKMVGGDLKCSRTAYKKIKGGGVNLGGEWERMHVVAFTPLKDRSAA